MAREFRRHRVSLLRPDGVSVCYRPVYSGQNTLNSRTLPGLTLISHHSLGIYGFHALIIHALRTRGIELQRWPLLDIVWIFTATLLASLALSMLVQRIDRRRLVS